MKNNEVNFKYRDSHVVNFILDNMKLEKIKVKVDYRLDNPDSIMASFKCRKEQYINFGSFVDQNKKFRIESISDNNITYYSDDVHFVEFQNTYGERDFDGTIEMYNYYCRINYEKEKIYHNYSEQSKRINKPVEGKRFIEFQIIEPYKIWDRFFLQDITENNKESIVKVNKMFRFAIDDLEISYYIKEIKHKTKSDAKYNEDGKKRVFFRIAESKDTNLGDNDFKSKLLEVFEELLSLISFVSSSRVDWLLYNFYGNKYQIWYLKSFQNQKIILSEKSNFIIDPHYLNAFLINSYKHLKEIDPHINLLIPIREYLSNKFAIYLEQHFLIIYIAFEKLSNDISNWLFNNENIFDKVRFNKIRKEIKFFLKNNSNISLNIEEFKKIQEKLSELNRTSLNRKLIELFKHYEIPYEKGLDEKGHFKFLEFRDKYIHSPRDYDGEALFDEYERVKKYFELLVLKLLDKNSLSHLHPDFKLKMEMYV